VPQPRVEVVSRETAEASLSSALNVVGGRKALIWAFVAESIRATLSGYPHGLVIQALTHRVRSLVLPVFPGVAPDDQTQEDALGTADWAVFAVRALKNLGDLCEIDVNRYGRCSARLVMIPDAEVVLLSGTAPCADASLQFSADVYCSGFARFVLKSDLGPTVLADSTLWQTLDTWVGVGEYPIVRWTDETITDLTRQLSPGLPIGVEAPEVHVAEDQARRWWPIATLKTAPDGLRLCRSIVAGDKFPSYFAALLRSAEAGVQATFSAPVTRSTALRLFYGIDSLRRAGTRVIADSSGEEVTLRNPALLPFPERKVLYLGTRLAGRYVFPIELFEVVKRTYELLGALVTVRTTGTGQQI